MELKKMIAPFDATEPLQYLEQIFGIEERLLEACQLNGSEAEYNQDIVYLAYEDDTLLGMIHATIPHKTPQVAGLSAMFTTPAARGKGLGKILFGTIVEEVSRHGARLTLLGTSNPIAAKLYAQFGFSFCPGSHVMARFSQGNMVDFAHDYYRQAQGKITLTPGDPSMRIPMIPLVLQPEHPLILDINTGIFNANSITQRSCMGLYPRYLALPEKGGAYFTAYDEAGTLGAVGSVLPQADGTARADFFCVSAFASVIPEMIAAREKAYGSVYVEIACNDRFKAPILKENGFMPAGDGVCETAEFSIRTVKYAK